MPGPMRRCRLCGLLMCAVFGTVALVAAWQVIDILLLVFLAILFGAVLRGLGDMLAARTRLSPGRALAVVVAVLALAAGGAGWLLALELADQLDELGQRLPEAVGALRERLAQWQWGEALLARLPSPDKLFGADGGVFGLARGVFASTLNVVGGVVVLLFLSVYLAADPALYRDGLLRLVPPARRARLAGVMDEVAQTLRWWMLGKLVSMTVVGVLVATALTLMDFELALLLGLLSALLNFVPNIGPVIASVPAILLALADGPERAGQVALLYVGVETLESYLLSPLIDKRTVEMPPALMLATQLAMSVLVGAIGLVAATPLLAVVLVLVRRLYVEDVLGDRDVQSDRPAQAAPDG